MAERYSILNVPSTDEESPPPKARPQSAPVSRLFACPDCQHNCSLNAESCPQCGRFFRTFDRTFSVTPGAGWSTAVGWGVILGWIFAAFIIFCLVILLIVLGAISAATLAPR